MKVRIYKDGAQLDFVEISDDGGDGVVTSSSQIDGAETVTINVEFANDVRQVVITDDGQIVIKGGHGK